MNPRNNGGRQPVIWLNVKASGVFPWEIFAFFRTILQVVTLQLAFHYFKFSFEQTVLKKGSTIDENSSDFSLFYKVGKETLGILQYIRSNIQS